MNSPRPKVPGVKAFIGRAVLKMSGWDIDGGLPDVPKAVVVAAPHTSNWDLVYSLASMWTLGLTMNWVGKKSLFEKPVFGWWMRALGGIGVDRSKRSNAVQAIAQVFSEHEALLLLVPPEGTRSKTTRWKTGFYWIAVEAKVPIVLGYVDFGRKRTGLGTVFHPTGDIQADFVKLREFYDGMKGRFPELQGVIALGDGDEVRPGQSGPQAPAA